MTGESATDEALDALSRRPRRVVLAAVNREGSVPVAELASRMRVDARDAEVALVHAHLPKLAARGYVEWRRNAGRVSHGPRFDEIEPLIGLFEDTSDTGP